MEDLLQIELRAKYLIYPAKYALDSICSTNFALITTVVY